MLLCFQRLLLGRRIACLAILLTYVALPPSLVSFPFHSISCPFPAMPCHALPPSPTLGSSSALSLAIKRVTFHLHPSFPNPIRVVEKPNMIGSGMVGYMVEEDGWGEFEAMIKIEWNSGSGVGGSKDTVIVKKGKNSDYRPTGGEEKPLVLKHPIRLYPAGTTHSVCGVPPPQCEIQNTHASGGGADPAGGLLSANAQLDMNVPVIHEFYDEVVFTDPTRQFYDLLMGSFMAKDKLDGGTATGGEDESGDNCDVGSPGGGGGGDGEGDDDASRSRQQDDQTENKKSATEKSSNLDEGKDKEVGGGEVSLTGSGGGTGGGGSTSGSGSNNNNNSSSTPASSGSGVGGGGGSADKRKRKLKETQPFSITSYVFPPISDVKTVSKLSRAVKFVEEELKIVKDRILRANTELEQAEVVISRQSGRLNK